MPVPARPTLCVYHADCSDGMASAWAVRRKFDHEIRFHPATYGHTPPDVTGEHVVLVDFSYTEPVLRAMCAQAASVTILDHHKTARDELLPLFHENLITGCFDTNRSGAVITWQHYHTTPLPRLFLHVQDQDLWRFWLEDTKAIIACVTSYPYDFESWDELVRRCEDRQLRDELILEGKAIVRKQLRDVELLLRLTGRRMVIGGQDVPVANVSRYMASDAADLIGEDEAFFASYLDRGDVREFSLRSRNDKVDVSEIARLYGGGGHFHAAGFQVPRVRLEETGLL